MNKEKIFDLLKEYSTGDHDTLMVFAWREGE